MQRVIGKFSGDEKGPLLVIIGAMHGNEPAGVRAIELVLKMLDVEYIRNPNFSFKGNVLGLIGNYKALEQKKRFIDRDMNRCWSPDVMQNQADNSIAEFEEIRQVHKLVMEEIETGNYSKVIILDMHTTSSDLGIFVIPSSNPESLKIAKELKAPVVLGIADGLKNTNLHYFHNLESTVPIIPVVFESGQHQDPMSVNRAVAAIINCMRTVEMVDSEHVDNIHDHLLETFSEPLPKVVELSYSHGIKAEDKFVMKPGYKNFDAIVEGEWLADDTHGKVCAPSDGRILMPLYQVQGEDGFFIVREVNR